jgi:uncharacterized membrane protein YciS (DUF1049 family)
MTGILAIAALVAGLVTGWLIRSVFVMAEISRSQERMQRKVRYWQGEAAHARSVADQLARELATATRAGLPPEWPPGNG